MKLRIKDNTLRYRLSKTDIHQLDTEGRVQEEVGFGSALLTYDLQRSKEVKELSADYKDNRITVLVPDAWAEELVKTERVGFDTYAEVGDGKILYLLLEKDFKCLDNVAEDQSDNYENPLAAKKND